MRILSIAHTPIRGGANISWLTTLKGLKDKGVNLLLIVSEEGFMTEQLTALSIPYKIVPFYFSVYPNKLNGLKNKLLSLPRLAYHIIKNKLATKAIDKIAKKFQPDIIHCNGSVVDIALPVAKEMNIPHVWHLREYTDLDFNYHLIPSKYSYFKKIKDDSFSISITPDIYKHFGICKNKGVVIFNGIYKKLDLGSYEKRQNKFIYVGGITENKGVTDLINSFIQYRKAGGKYSLEILGAYTPEYYSFLQQLLIANNMEKVIHFRGQVSNVKDYMRTAKAIIVPSKNEGFGRITAEAMFFGCLVIGRDTAGTKMQFDLGKNQTGTEIGLRFTNNSELMEAMLKASEIDQANYSSITNNAAQVALNNYSVDTNLEHTYKFFNRILNEKKG